jgi:acetyltransferase-like isoleucine patch superfamily enzyme
MRQAVRSVLHGVYYINKYAAGAWGTFWGYLKLFILGANVSLPLKVYGKLELHIHPQANIQIGKKLRLNSGPIQNPVAGSSRLVFWVERGATLSIGENVGISNSTIVCTKSIEIGNDVYIGGGCKIYDTDFHSINASDRLNSPDNSVEKRSIVVGDKAFIGGHSIVLKGVTIGSQSVIGAGSVVTKNVPANEIWAGNPAKKILNGK